MPLIEIKRFKKQANPCFAVVNLDSESYLPELESSNCNGTRKNTISTSIYGVFRILLKFLYYLNIIPYKIIEENSLNGDHVQFITSRFRQVIAITVHLIGHIISTLYILVSLEGPSIQKDPEKLFRIVTSVTYQLTALNFTKLCLADKNGLKSLMRVTFPFYIQRVQSTSNARTKNLRNKTVAIGFCFSCLIFWIINFKNNFQLDKTVSSLEDLINSVNKNWYNYLSWKHITSVSVNASTHNVNDNHDNIFSQPWKIIVVLFCVCCSTCISGISYCSGNLIHFVTFAFYILSHDFWKSVKELNENCSQRDLEQLFNCYREMKSLTEDINRIMGIQILVYTAAAIPYNVSTFTTIFDNPDWEYRAENVFYICIYITTLTLAAEAYRKNQEFSDYLYRHFSTTVFQNGNSPSHQLMMSEISSSQIGLKGFAFFTISYSFLGQVVGILITYIIIHLQFQSSSTRRPEESVLDGYVFLCTCYSSSDINGYQLFSSGPLNKCEFKAIV